MKRLLTEVLVMEIEKGDAVQANNVFAAERRTWYYPFRELNTALIGLGVGVGSVGREEERDYTILPH